MESGSEVNVQDESCAVETPLVESSAVVLTNEGQNVDSGKKALATNEISEPVAETEKVSSSKTKMQASVSLTKSKSVKASKEPGTAVGSSKNNKLAKEKPILTGVVQSPRPNRRTLSQSLSFPARGASTDVMDKSIDKYPVKTVVKRTAETGIKSTTQISEDSKLKNPSKNALNRVINKGVNINTASSAQRSSLASVPGDRSVTVKIATVNTTSDSLPSESAVSIKEKRKPGKSSFPLKEDDDAHSTSSSVTPRGRINNCPGFSFRLNERAEKRKEFFMKLEEKIQAKEVEKTNLQAKSKESQQAEIKQLRKSLTFKATPMPSFYKEPPPKPELHKIPNTRPKSPKLGRNKSLLAAEAGPSVHSPRQNGEPSNSPKAFRAKSNKETTILKKPAKKLQTKLRSNEAAASKTEGAAIKPKPKINRTEIQHPKPDIAETTKQQEEQPVNRPEPSDGGDLNSGLDPLDIKEPATAASPEIMAPEISVGG